MAGVYMILNLVTDWRYVGSTRAARISRRWAEHKYKLRRGKGSRLMQADWDIAGASAFAFVVLETCAPIDAKAREQRWLDQFIQQGTPIYNLYRDVLSPNGYHHTDAVKEAKRLESAGRRQPLEARRKIGDANRGRPRPDVVGRCAKDWPDLVGPDNVQWQVHNLLAFARDHGLNAAHLYQVAHGARRSHRGWRLATLYASSGAVSE